MGAERNVVGRLLDYLGLAGSYVWFNLRAQMAYRNAFASQIVGMIVNDAIWVTFWVIFFTRFPVIAGWHARDVITLWALVATGFGMAYAFYGNSLTLANLIVQGQLDAWMLYPRSLLPHLLLGKMNATAWGDILFGIGVYATFAHPDPAHLAWFLALAICVAVVFVGFGVLTGSLALYIGNATALASQWQNAAMSFATYPDALFSGVVKVLLYTLLPAGFISYLPMHALRTLSPADALLAACGALGVLALGTAAFYHGLKRYESGNLLEMRG